MSKILMVKLKPQYEKFEPEYRKGWQEANSQFSVTDDKLYIDYEDDDEPGLHDVSYKYEWKYSDESLKEHKTHG